MQVFAAAAVTRAQTVRTRNGTSGNSCYTRTVRSRILESKKDETQRLNALHQYTINMGDVQKMTSALWYLAERGGGYKPKADTC